MNEKAGQGDREAVNSTWHSVDSDVCWGGRVQAAGTATISDVHRGERWGMCWHVSMAQLLVESHGCADVHMCGIRHMG